MRHRDDTAPVMTLTSGPVNAYPEVLQGLARTDRPYVRQYDEETNLRCALLLDRSGSMARLPQCSCAPAMAEVTSRVRAGSKRC